MPYAYPDKAGPLYSGPFCGTCVSTHLATGPIPIRQCGANLDHDNGGNYFEFVAGIGYARHTVQLESVFAYDAEAMELHDYSTGDWTFVLFIDDRGDGLSNGVVTYKVGVSPIRSRINFRARANFNSTST